MSDLTAMAFSPTDGLRNTSSYPTTPVNETAAREQFQGRLDELRDYLNNTLIKLLTGGSYKYYTSAAGSDAYAVTVAKFPAAYEAGQWLLVKADVANTGACTLAVNALAATAIKTQGGADPANGDISAGSINLFIHDGTNWVHMTPTAILASVFTAAGDLLYATGAGAPARLAKGTAGQLLAMNSGATAPEWVNPFASIVEKTDSFTLALTEANVFVKCNKGTAMNCTVPPNADVAFPTGTEIELFQYGAGAVTVVAGSGVTIRSKSGNLKIDGQYAGAALKKIDTNEWVLVGSLTS